MSTALTVLLMLGPAACSKNESPKPAASETAQIPVSQLPQVNGSQVLDHIKVLAADDMEGRSP